MNSKGTQQDQPAIGVSHHETANDKRIMVITLRDEARMTGTKIGRRLGIDRRTVRKVKKPVQLSVKEQ
jgi:hypothetical protein